MAGRRQPGTAGGHGEAPAGEEVDLGRVRARLVLVSGPEELLAERAVASVVEALRAREPQTEVIRVEAEAYEAGALVMHASPSLFGGAKALVVRGAAEMGEALQEDLLAVIAGIAADPQGSEATLVVVHRGGTRGKRVLDALRAAGAHTIAAPAVKTDREKAQFVQNEMRVARRRIAPEAAAALVLAVGKNVRELAAACAQLVADTTGVIDAETVERYHGGRVETTGFKVAEAALAGDLPRALGLVRHAMGGGLDPVPLIAVLAMQLRQVGRVMSEGQAPSGQTARRLGMAPWQVDQARRAGQGWSSDGLGRALQACAQADHEVKGGGLAAVGGSATSVARDPAYAVERLVRQICELRSSPPRS